MSEGTQGIRHIGPSYPVKPPRPTGRERHKEKPPPGGNPEAPDPPPADRGPGENETLVDEYV